ncbi:MAG TPA: CPBP family intramembrane glutamic endopeptidase [Gammaproteobacteria bacterium]|nr:CPBP family intramembrane glutamic endopeptidase [Gammaproteobacteria bacterium]
MALQSRPPYLDAALGLAAVALIGLSSARSRRLWKALPAPKQTYAERVRASFAWVAPFTLAGALLFLAVALVVGKAEGGWPAAAARVLNWHLLPALAIYLLWALVQQFVFQFYLLVRLLYLIPERAAVVVTAVLFSAVHFPRFIVMAAVAVAALVWCSLYRRYRTLLPLAVSHAILGSTLHYWAFGRDLLSGWLGH